MTNEKLVYCRTPIVPERKFPVGFPTDPARAIIAISSKWVPGTVLTYCFLDEPSTLAGGDAEKKIAREGFDAWNSVDMGITLEEVADPSKAKIHVGFKWDGGYWSYIGRDILKSHYICRSCGEGSFPSDATTPRCPNCASNDVEVDPRTMNLDKNQLTSDSRGSDVPTHEMGHSLGLPHEHQSPYGGIEWDEQAVYNEFSEYPNNWSKETIDSNILKKLSTNEVEGSQWDPDSIMEYAFPPGMILEPEKYRTGLTPAGGISAIDKEWIKHWYPSLESEEIKLNTPVTLNLQPGKAREFYFIPSETRAYDFQTSGESETVIVLFEEVDGKRHQLDADDDSGEKRNAHIRHDLTSGNKFILVIRMYWDYTAGDIILKVW